MRTDVSRVDALHPGIPGMSLRAYRPSDAGPTANLYNRTSEADGDSWRTDAAELANWYATASDGFDPARDLRLVEVGEQLVAVADVNWVDTRDGLREYRLGCAVDPEWRGQGIGRWLQAINEEHARELTRVFPTERPAVYGAWSPDSATHRIALLEHLGYEPVRWFFNMVRPNLDDIPEPELPAGLEFRPVADHQIRQLWDADVEAFQDHWGGFDASQSRFEKWKRDPLFDPTLFVVAWDGDEIAGGVWNEINETANAMLDRKQGWLASVFVRRPWRRRGVGRALVLRSLEVVRDRGMTSAGLGVDADNPTGALGLYERVGFVVDFRSTAYRKPLGVVT